MTKKTYEIVSLGTNCLPRTILTRAGIKPTKAEGELSTPFDLVAHKLSNIVHYLQTDFSDYFDDIYFDIRKRNFLDFRKKGFWKKRASITRKRIWARNLPIATGVELRRSTVDR